MIYTLIIWTAVAASDASKSARKVEYDWRPIGEFHMESGRYGPNYKTAKEMCEEAARQLVLKADKYRCIKSK